LKGIIRIGDIVGPGLGEDGLVADSAKLLIDSKICDETITAGSWVALTSETNVSLGQYAVEALATVYGMAVTGGNLGDEIDIVLMGRAEYSFIPSRPINTILYLGANGTSRTTMPPSGYRTRVGVGYGASVLIQIYEPIEI